MKTAWAQAHTWFATWGTSVFHVSLAVLFLLMLLAPCVIALRGRAQDEAEADTETELEPVHEIPVLAHVETLPEEPAAVEMQPVIPVAHLSPLTGMARLEAEAQFAQAVLARAQAAAMESLARLASARADVAVQAAVAAEKLADEANISANRAIDVYQDLVEQEANLRRTNAAFAAEHAPRKAA